MYSNKFEERNQLNSLVEKVCEIQHKVDDLVCSIYPPQDKDQLLNNASELTAIVSCVLEFCTSGTKIFENSKLNLKKVNTITTTLTGQALQELEEICKNENK